MATTVTADAAPSAGDKLAKMKRYFDDFRNASQAPRIKQQRAINYFHDIQLTPVQRTTLMAAKQPITITNRIKPAVNGTIGVVARGKTDPRAYPRNPQDAAAADVASEVLRYVADKNRFPRLKLKVLWDILVPGCGASIIHADESGDVLIEQIPWAEFFYDPRSRRDDFQDARYLGIAKWMYADQVEMLFPNAKTVISDGISAGEMLPLNFGLDGESFEDRPDTILNPWFDKRLRRLMVVECYYNDAGTWRRCVYCGAAVLDEGASPYLDDAGRPMCPIEAQSGYVDSDNCRYGMVQTMIPIQDVINLTRRQAAHYTNMRQIQQVDLNAPPVDAELARQQARLPDGVIPPGWQVVPTTDMMQGNLALQQEAKGEIERMAPVPSIVGRNDPSASGRAQLVQSQAGMTEFAPIFEGFSDWEFRVYHQAWARVRQYWKAPKYIRTTGKADAMQLVQINEPVTDEFGQAVIDPRTGQPVVKNEVAKMDMDIIVDSVPDTANVQQEQFAELMQLLSSNPAWAADVTFSDAVELSSLVNKSDFLKKMKERQEQGNQQRQQAEARAAQIAEQTAEADLHKTQSETLKNDATAKNTEAKTVQIALDAAMAVDPAIPGGATPPPPQEQPPLADGQFV